MGNRIASFAEGSRLAQFATPLEILINAADFVRSFIGEGTAIRRLPLLKVGDPVSGRNDSQANAYLAVQADETLAGADR